MYLILNPSIEEHWKEKYPNIKKIERIETYSSDTTEKFEKDELIEILKKSKLLEEGND